MAVTRSAPASQPESLRSGEWWDAKNFQNIRERAAQRRAAGDLAGLEKQTQAERLSLELTKMEAIAGLGIPHKIAESFLGQSSLIHFQKGLGAPELLLSFNLGEGGSYLWAVTANSLNVYRLPVRVQVAGWVNFPLRRWSVGRANNKAVYMVERHSIQMIPGALLLSRATGQPTSRYVAVEDPIYNFADSRSAPAPPRGPPRAEPRENPGQLNRSVISWHAVEVDVLAPGAWQAALEYWQASRIAGGS
jgi:hypothetical protein